MANQRIERRTFLKGGGLVGVLAATYLAIKKASELEAKPVLDENGQPEMMFGQRGKWLTIAKKADGTHCIIYTVPDEPDRVIG